MTSHLANLYDALQSLIAGLKDPERNPYFRFVDQEMGQLEAARPPVTWPCVLIDIDDVLYQNMSNNVQTGIAKIVFRLGFPPLTSGSSITPGKAREKALYYYELEQLLHHALQGTLPTIPGGQPNTLAEVFGHFCRISARTEHRRDTIRVRNLTYSIALQDYTTQHTTILTPAAMNLNIDFEQ